jgi:hypothetical protein
MELTAVSVVIVLATSVAVFLVGQSLLHGTGETASLSQPDSPAGGPTTITVELPVRA